MDDYYGQFKILDDYYGQFNHIVMFDAPGLATRSPRAISQSGA